MSRDATPFGAILRAAVEDTPGAVGGAFAASDGEMVDAFSELEAIRWATLTAHYGIVLALARSALLTFHYGDAELLTLRHDQLDVLIGTVGDGYFALLAIEPPTPLAHAMAVLNRTKTALAAEMF